MGNPMNQASFSGNNPMCSMGSMSNGMNAFNQANNNLNAMSVGANGQGMGLGMGMGVGMGIQPAMGFMGGINQLNPTARYMGNDAMSSAGAGHPLSQLPSALNSPMSSNYNQMQHVPLQHQNMSHQGLMSQNQMMN